MDKDERLLKILGKLSGGRLEDVADKLMALFREPEWWEEEFEKQFVARGPIGAFQDADTCDAVKAFISTLLTRAQHEEHQKLLMDIERISETYFAGAASPEETASARKLYALLLHDLRHKDETPPAKPGRLWYSYSTRKAEAGAGPLWVCKGACDALALLAAGMPRVVALFGVQGWRWEWGREVRELVCALDADTAGQQQWRQLTRQAALRGKAGAVLEPAAYGGHNDVSEAWAAGVLAVGAGPAAAAVGGEVLAMPQHLRGFCRKVRFWLLLDSRVVDLSMAYNPTLVILSSLKPFFFNGLKNELRFLDNVGA
jgi:Toprim domain